MYKTLIASQHGVGGATSGGLRFLFIKEGKVAETEELKNLKRFTRKRLQSKRKKSPQRGRGSELEEEEKEASELEEGDLRTRGRGKRDIRAGRRKSLRPGGGRRCFSIM